MKILKTALIIYAGIFVWGLFASDNVSDRQFYFFLPLLVMIIIYLRNISGSVISANDRLADIHTIQAELSGVPVNENSSVPNSSTVVTAPQANTEPVIPITRSENNLRNERLNNFFRIETVSRDLAENFVKRCAWWDHPSGQYVRAPRHAKNIALTRQGWTLSLGANEVLAGKAIERCRKTLIECINKMESGEENISRELIISALKHDIARSVANHSGYEYTSGYSSSGGYMHFGTQIICLDDASKFILEISGADEVFKPALKKIA